MTDSNAHMDRSKQNEQCSEVQTVDQITDEHRYWLIEVRPYDRADTPFRTDTFVLGKGFGSGVRSWEYDGKRYVGLVDDDRRPGIYGTEHSYPADTPCRLVRPVRRRRKR